MPNQMQPFANESDVIRIGNMEIENRLDRISISGDLVITKDHTGLALAKELQLLIGSVVKALQAEPQLPQAVPVAPDIRVKNPFS